MIEPKNQEGRRRFRRSKAALVSWQKMALYIVSLLLWLSGILWLYFRYFWQTSGEFGAGAPPAQAICLKIHGAVAMAFLMGFGVMLVGHVPPGWQQKDQRPSGTSLLMTCGILIATGWGLYYLGDELWRRWTSAIHSVLGGVFPLILLVHAWLANRRLKRSKER